MRGRPFILVFWLLVVAVVGTLVAQDATVEYLEGDPQHRTSAGASRYLDFGSRVAPGDSVVTGRGDFVELRQGDAAAIRVNANTVFTIREVERGEGREQVLSTSVGSVAMRFNRLAGREPMVGTTTTVAGVRGTELVIYAGADGSSLFLVESGLVEVTSSGRSVELAANEGVEVPAGGPPGEKFEWLGRQLDFRDWNEGKRDEALSDPVAAVGRFQAVIDEFIDGAQEFGALAAELMGELDESRKAFYALTDQDQQNTLRDEVILPLQERTGVAVLNYRYFALSALSFRRYVMAPLYIEMRTRNILNAGNTYEDFKRVYGQLLRLFEDEIVPWLVEADI